MAQESLLKEKYGCLGVENIFIKPSAQDSIVRVDETTTSRGSQRSSILLWVKQFFTEVFLPQGYPFSVSDDYWSYQFWDTVQAFCSSICGNLTTHAIMKGVGVGDTAATPLAAAITWILKDGTGMMGRIVFAWWKGSRLDAECKAWRLLADVLNDIAMLAEMVLPYVPTFSTYILCASQSAKAIVGVAGGATRAAITQHQAVRGNTGDVSAKDGSQEMCVNLLASFVGIFLLTTVTDPLCVWGLFLLSACLHIIANYQAVLALKLLSLNTERFNYILEFYLKSGKISLPSEVNSKESVFPGFGFSTKQLCGFDVYLGCSLQQYLKCRQISAKELQSISNVFRNNKYMLLIDTDSQAIFVILQENESPKDIIQAYFHSVSIALVFALNKKLPLSNIPGDSSKSSEYLGKLANLSSKLEGLSSERQISEVLESQDFFTAEFKQFHSNLEAQGWKTDRHHLIIDEWRASWSKIE